MGRRTNENYLRTWQMEPLTLAVIAALTPGEVEVRLYDDRQEAIPFDEPTDLVALTVETYTAKRAYQIASEYRLRGVPVVMGGFHPTLCPEEAADYADSVVIGQAENVWAQVIDDYRCGRPEKLYRGGAGKPIAGLRPRRSLFLGKGYLPVGLVEASRGCPHRCDFCAIGAYHGGCQSWRPVDDILAEMKEATRDKKLIFIVDDNIGSNLRWAKELFRGLTSERIRWVSQCSITAARDEEFLDLAVRSGCQGLLIGFESLNARTLKAMNKSFNTVLGTYEKALENLARHRVRIYGTFVFGYDRDSTDNFSEAVTFARNHGLYLAAFNHLVPFPGTELYRRLESEKRLLYERWWLDDRYTFNDIAFRPAQMSPEELRARCMQARKEFYSWPSILKRSLNRANRSSFFMFRNYFFLNAQQRLEVGRRDHYPLGDERWKRQLLPAKNLRSIRAGDKNTGLVSP